MYEYLIPFKQVHAEAEAEGQKWSNGLSPLGSFVSIVDCQSLDFDVWFDIEFYYLVDVSETPWKAVAYEIMRDYASIFEKHKMLRFTRLTRYQIFDEPLPYLLKCEICRDQYPREMMEKDHIIPKSKGGKGKRFNTRYVCANCHSYLHRCDKRTFSTLGQLPVVGGTAMANSHDTAAKLVARKLRGKYNPQTSPDVKGKGGRAEVKSTVDEIPQALRQLGGGSGPAFVVLPSSQQKKALERMVGLKTGLMNYKGRIIKPSTRKK